MKNGKLTHRLSWAIYYFRNKKQKDDKENTSQCIGYCFPPKRVLRGGWANTFWETTHSEEHSPSDVWSCFPSKYQTYLPGVISVFWDFKQISSPTDNPKKNWENFVNESTPEVRELFIPLGGSGNWCHMSGADTPSAINSGPPCQRYFHTSWNISVLDFHIQRSVLWLTFLVNTVQYVLNIFVLFQTFAFKTMATF